MWYLRQRYPPEIPAGLYGHVHQSEADEDAYTGHGDRTDKTHEKTDAPRKPEHHFGQPAKQNGSLELRGELDRKCIL